LPEPAVSATSLITGALQLGNVNRKTAYANKLVILEMGARSDFYVLDGTITGA
jgi:hypothetical protein